MFMDSSGHRKNILGRAWDVIGVGAYQGPGDKKMWTVLFADKCGANGPQADRQAHAQADRQAQAREADAQAEAGSAGDPQADPEAHAEAHPKPTPTPDAHARRRDPQFEEGPVPDRTPVVATASARAARTTATARAATTATAARPATARRPVRRRARPGSGSSPRTIPAGLLETIVGGVAGVFFGG